MDYSIRTSLLLVSALAAWLPALRAGEPGPALRDGFQNPPATFRPLIITHSRHLKDPNMAAWLAERRAGGAVLDAGVKPGSKDTGGEPWNNPTYLNDPEVLKRFRETVTELRSRGLTVWVYDELGYPSGSAGGRVLDGHPEYQVWVVGSRTFSPDDSGAVRVDVKHPKVEACYAVPRRGGALLLEEAKDLSSRARQGSFTWQAPSAEWVVGLFERYQPDTWRRHNIPRRNVNILDRNAIQRFIRITHDRYAEIMGDQLKQVELFFTDEPQFGAAEHWGSGLPETAPAVQWSEELPAAFERKYGYRIASVLPALFHPAGPKTAKYRHDFYDVQSDLVAENYFGQIQDWCRRHGVLSSGHLLLEESLLFHLMFSGSYLKAFERMDLPGVDLIGRTPPRYKTMAGWGRERSEDFSCKLAASVAHLMGKPGVFTETYALADKATLREALGVAAWQFSGGITHMSTYTIQNHFPAADYAAFADFAGRLAFFGRRGVPVADVAVLVPELSIWAAYNPPDGGRFRRYLDRNPQAMEIDDVFNMTSHALLNHQREFEFFSDNLLQQAAIEDGHLVLGGQRFGFLILPETRMLRKDTLAKTRSFLESGGHVAIVGSLPSQTPESGEDPGVTREIRTLLAAHPGRMRHVEPAGLDQLIAWMKQRIGPAFRWDGPSAIRVMHRREPEREILLLANPSKENAEGKLALQTSGAAWIWNPETGVAESAGQQGQGAELDVAVPAESARIVTWERSGR